MTTKPEAPAQGASATTMSAGPRHDPNGPQTRAKPARVGGGFESLDVIRTKEVYEELNGVLDKLAPAVVQTLDQVVPYLAKMQSLLSQRGADRKKVLRQAGLPGWTEWARAYAGRLDRSLRTVQDFIRRFRNPQASGKADPTGKARSSSNGGRIRLDSRQQAALVKAQLAANDLVAALRNGADWQTPLAEYERVAVAPARLDAFMNASNPAPDCWALLAKLADAVEECGDRLTARATDVLHEVKAALAGSAAKKRLPSGQPPGAAEKRTRARRQRREDGTRSEAQAEELPAEGVKKLPPPAKDAPRLPSPGSGEDGCEASAAPSRPGSRLGNFTLNEDGKWEFDPEVGIREVERTSSAQPEAKPLPRARAATDAGKAYHVKKRILGDDRVDFAIFRRGDKTPYDLYETESEAGAVCAALNSSPAASVAPQRIDGQPAANSAAQWAATS